MWDLSPLTRDRAHTPCTGNGVFSHWRPGKPQNVHFKTAFHKLEEGDGSPLQCSCLENPRGGGAWWAAVHGVAKSRTRLSDFTFTFQFHALEKEMATHSSVLAWRIPGTGEPGGLPSVGSHRVGHDWSDLATNWSIAFADKPLNVLGRQHSTSKNILRLSLSLIHWLYQLSYLGKTFYLSEPLSLIK